MWKIHMKAVKNFKNAIQGSCEKHKMGSVDGKGEAEEDKSKWMFSGFKEKLREQLLKPMRYNPQMVEKLEAKDWDYFLNIEYKDRNHLFLWAAFESELVLLQLCLDNGADVSFIDGSNNFNALHLAAIAGSVECCKWLLEKGCPIIETTDKMTPIHYATLGNSKEVVEYLINYGCEIPSTAVNSAVYAHAIECVKFLISSNAEINAYYDGMTPLHLATNLRYIECMKELLNDPRIDVNLKVEPGAYTALHLAAENGYVECIELLLKKRAKINEMDSNLQTPLHVASKKECLDTIEVLLRNDAIVNEKDVDHKTPLHVAITKSPNSLNKIKLLVEWKADVNVSDKYGYTPLHLAAINELEECASYLILNGANVAAETKKGTSALNMIIRKTPKSIDAIWNRLTKSLVYNHDQSLIFNLRELITNSSVGEIGFLYTLIKEEQKDILKHPLCRAFLYLKWEKVKKIYIIRVLSVILTACILSSLVLCDVIEENCDSSEEFRLHKNTSCLCYFKQSDEIGEIRVNENVLQMLWYFAIISAISNVLRNLSFRKAYPSFKKYLSNNLNLFELVIMFLVLFLFSTKNQTEGTPLCQQRKLIGTCLILVTWTDLTLVIGQLPFFGTYITMFNKVFRELLKLLTVYFCLLIGFTLTYSSILHDEKNPFDDLATGFAQILAMMTGELSAHEMITQEFHDHYHKYAATIVLIFFIVVLNMSLMNLLIGIAASDVEGLQKTAASSKLVHQSKLIYYLEVAFFKGYIPSRVTEFFKKFLLVAINSDTVVVHVRPYNPLETKLPKDIMIEGLQLAAEKNNPDQGGDDEIISRLETLESKIEKLENMLISLTDAVTQKIST